VNSITALQPGHIRDLVIAGWTGRDRAAQEKHIAELERLGVRRPAATPVYYRVSASRLTLADVIQTPGSDSSGEVEFVIFQLGGALWVGVGSDHTDRKVETYNITVSKQMCDKPVASEIWPFYDVRDHWDALVLRSWEVNGSDQALYQEGSVTAMLHPQDLVANYIQNGYIFADGTAMFGGTLAAIGGIRSANRFEFELEDPVLNRRITHAYDIVTLPVAG
jgi:hypothetical protein